MLQRRPLKQSIAFFVCVFVCVCVCVCVSQVQQIFERFSAPTPSETGEARFRYFTGTVWPRLQESIALRSGGLLLFVPSYFDFVRYVLVCACVCVCV